MLTKEREFQTKCDLKKIFGKKLPPHLDMIYADIPCKCLDQPEMMKIIDFHPPFLRAEKIAIFEEENSGIKNYRSLGMGLIYPADTNGHYNSTIYLAMCGWLMASTASVHLAYNFSEFAPQVVEADKVKPFKSVDGIGSLKPRPQGTTFWVETIIRKSKLKLVLVTTNISFGNFAYGTIEDLKFILTPKDSIWKAKEVQED